jgi:Nucleotide modification associated domain 3
MVKIILSRKGFDRENGGVPSPIFPDGSLISLPIPRKSTLQYAQINFCKDGLRNLGQILEPLTAYRLSDSCCAHLDPDLDAGSIEREDGWRGIFGQSGTAQRILSKAGVEAGSLFLFFGQFCEVDKDLRFVKKDENTKHVIFGWLKVGVVFRIPDQDKGIPHWARYHPHLNFGSIEKNPNAIYIAAESLSERSSTPGWGVFKRYDPRLCLTKVQHKGSQEVRGQKCVVKPSLWELPAWMNPWNDPDNQRKPLGFHTNKDQWRGSNENAAILQSVGRGQEFVLDCEAFPEAIDWAEKLIEQFA